MASEPELSAGSGGEWVLYLQQSLNHHYQQQVIAESGDFDDALTGVVRHFQRQQGIEPTGVADAGTWQALTGGASAVPATRYRWPDEPVAAATVEVDGAVVELALTLTGELDELSAADDLLTDLHVDLTTDPPGPAGAAFLPGTATLADRSTLESTGECRLDGVWYRLSVSVLPHDPADEPPDTVTGWLEHHAATLASVGAVGAVALTATAGPVEAGG